MHKLKSSCSFRVPIRTYGSSAEPREHEQGYVDKIIRGTEPRELPVQQPTRYELAINLKTAEALGLSLPQSLVAVADIVIE